MRFDMGEQDKPEPKENIKNKGIKWVKIVAWDAIIKPQSVLEKDADKAFFTAFMRVSLGCMIWGGIGIVAEWSSAESAPFFAYPVYGLIDCLAVVARGKIKNARQKIKSDIK
jgi:hypothetical protein